jgi:hypothetical protein
VATDRSIAARTLDAWRDKLRNEHTCVGSLEVDGIQVGLEKIFLPEASTAQRVQALLSHPKLDALLIACALSSLKDAASPVPRIDRLVVMPPSEETTPQFQIDDAWRTIGHALHDRSHIEWNNTPVSLQTMIRTIWNP